MIAGAARQRVTTDDTKIKKKQEKWKTKHISANCVLTLKSTYDKSGTEKPTHAINTNIYSSNVVVVVVVVMVVK